MKKILPIILLVFTIFSLSIMPTSAVSFPIENSTILDSSRASITLSDYTVHAKKGPSIGAFVIDYNIYSNTVANEIGIEQVVVYKSNGSHVTTIRGTRSNGLIASQVDSIVDSYTYYGVSGNSYYAEVTIFAKNSSGEDSRTITTNIVEV